MTNRRGRAAWTALALFVAAFVVRAVSDLSFDHAHFVYFEKPVLDAAFYDEWARRILGGEWIGTSVFEGVPLYGYFLALVYGALGSGSLGIALVQAAFGAAGVALLYLYCRSVFSEAVAIVAGAIYALYAPAIFYESFRLADGLATFFTPAVLLASLALVRRPTLARAGATGLLLGIATLARERFVLFAPILLAFLVVRHRRGVARMARPLVVPAILALGVALPLGLSLAHNLAAADDAVVLSSSGGVNFYIGNRPGVTGTYDPPREFGLGRDEQYARARQIAEANEGRSLKASEVSSYFTRRGLDAWASSPGDLFQTLWLKLSNFWKGFELYDAVDYYGSLHGSVVLSLPLPNFRTIGPLALVGLVVVWLLRRRDAIGIGLLYGFVGANLAFLLAFFVTSRFRVSVMPALFPFAAATLVWIVEFARARRFAPLAIGLLAVGGAAVFVNVDPPFANAAVLESVSRSNLGVMLLRERRYDEAEREFREAIRLQPHFAQPKWTLSKLLFETNRPDEALRAVEEAAADDPTNSQGLSYLAQIYLDRKQPQRALPVLERARRIDPKSGRIAFNLARAYQDTGRPREAIDLYRQAALLDAALAPDAQKHIVQLGGQ